MIINGGNKVIELIQLILNLIRSIKLSQYCQLMVNTPNLCILLGEKEQEMMEDEDKLPRKKSKYLPPGVDLPCECIYEKGKIQVSQDFFFSTKGQQNLIPLVTVISQKVEG